MSNDNETQIVWRLTRAEKGRYVAAARKKGQPLVAWLKDVADANSEPLPNDPGQGDGRNLARPEGEAVDGR